MMRVRYNSIEWPHLGWIEGAVKQQDCTGRVLVHFDCGHAEWIMPWCLERPSAISSKGNPNE